MASYRRLRSGLWQATVRTPTGRRITRTDPLKSVVRGWAEDEEVRIRRGEWADPRDGRITVGDWFKRWSSARVVEVASSKRDASHWRCHIEPRWGSVRLAAVTSWDLEAWAGTMARNGVPPSTRYGTVRLMKQIMGEATRHKLIPADPASTLRPPRPPKHVDRVLSRDEYDQLRAQASGRDRAIMDLMAYAGLRWGEVAGLHSARVDTMRRRIQVMETRRHNGTIKPVPKSQAGQREVPLTDQLALDLSRLLGEQLVFPGLSYSNWRRRVFLPAVEAAGLAAPAPTPHDLRHAYGSWLAEDGVPAHEIAALMGHASLAAVQRYIHATERRFERARASLMRGDAASTRPGVARRDA